MKIRGIKNIEYFTKGHRGILYTGSYKGKKVVIKTKLPESKAVGRITNEVKYLKLLNKRKIGPKLLTAKKDYLVYGFIDGDFILKNFKKSNKINILKAIKAIFRQLFIMDRLKINKEEMHHPLKHIIIDRKNKPWLVDFERCYNTKKPKNVTQFSVFLISGHLKNLLEEKGIRINRDKMIKAAKEYKKNINKEKLDKVISLVS